MRRRLDLHYMLSGKQRAQKLMTKYRAVFIRVEGRAERHLEPTYGLVASTREEAENEALRLHAPEEANSIKLFRDGRYEAPPIGIAL